MKVKMIVASHKPYKMPQDRNVYLPVLVGATLRDKVPGGFQPDNQGDNISAKNPYYNELTGIYWAWKNLSCDIIGLDHYRRYFVSRRTLQKDFNKILNSQQIIDLVDEGGMVVPQKRKYYIETIESHYLHSHSKLGLISLKNVFIQQSVDYQNALKDVLQARSAHMFNMFIMKKTDFDDYCSWLFGVLGQVDDQIDYNQLLNNEKRVLGFLAELLLDVWIKANKKDYVESPVLFMESNHWPKKISIFLLNKICRGRLRLNTHIK